MDPGLDSSWCGALIHFAASNLQFGKDVIFTYGPLSHLISFAYTGELVTVRVVWEFASKTLFAVILCGTILRLPKIWRPVFFLYVLLFIWVDPISDALYFLVIACATAALLRTENVPAILAAFIGVFLGACSLIKFTYFLLAIFALVFVVGFNCTRRRHSTALTLALSFMVSILLCWKLAGQSFANIPAYIASSLDICFGYKEAMGWHASSQWIVAAGIAALCLGLLQCGLILLDSRRWSVLWVTLFFAGETLLSWNRAFVRADDHVLSFFAVCPGAILALSTTWQPRSWLRHLGHATNCLILGVCLGGIILQHPEAMNRCLIDTRTRITRTWSIVTGLGSRIRELDAMLQQARLSHRLPKVHAEVGNQTLDVFGYEQGIALLNDFNYTPRPIFQGYSSYHPRLIATNTAFYSSDRAPAYVLLKYQTIDERYPSLDDAGVLRQILFNYTPLFQEHGYTLWKQNGPVTPVSPSPVATHSLLFDEVCQVPAGKNIWVELELRKSVRGHLRNLLYKPPQAEIWVNDGQGHQIVHRLVPSMSSSGFIFNPQLETPRDLLEAALGLPTKSAVSFLVHVPRENRRYFQRRFTARVASLPELQKENASAAAPRPWSYKALFGDDDPQSELADAFHASSQVLLDAKADGFKDFSALNQAALNVSDRGVEISAQGADVQVLLPKLTLGPGQKAVLRIGLEAPADTGLQLFYRPEGATAYNDYPMNRFVRRGTNSLYFELSETETAGGPLRLDPGMVPGPYLITHFELRLLPAGPSDAPRP